MSLILGKWEWVHSFVGSFILYTFYFLDTPEQRAEAEYNLADANGRRQSHRSLQGCLLPTTPWEMPTMCPFQRGIYAFPHSRCHTIILPLAIFSRIPFKTLFSNKFWNVFTALWTFLLKGNFYFQIWKYERHSVYTQMLS